MSFNYLDDLNRFFGDMGEPATYTPNGGDPSPITVLFSREFVAIEGVETMRPVVTAKTSDVSTAKADDSVSLAAGTFTVFGVQDDGTGLTTLILTAD